MKKTITALLLACLSLAACSNPRVLDGKVYDSYGFLNEQSLRSRNVCYSISPAAIILTIVFAETILVPIYFVGFDLFDPIRLKKSIDDTCDFAG